MTKILGECDGCGGTHEATPHHWGVYGEGQVYIVTCPEDGLATFVTREGLVA